MDKKSSKVSSKILLAQFLLTTALYVIAVTGAALNFEQDSTMFIWVMIVGSVIFAVSVCLFIYGLWRVSEYVCSCCGETVKPKFKDWLIHIHVGFSRRLYCPHCGKRCWCKHVAFTKDK